MYEYNTNAFDNEIRRERKRESRTDTITTVAGWRAVGGIVTTSANVYDSIRYTLGREIADNFIKNF